MNKIRVTLIKSDNTYLTYPCVGTLELFELGTDGSIIVGVWRGETGGPVEVRNPVFTYPATTGSAA